jgi:hypothetical protein
VKKLSKNPINKIGISVGNEEGKSGLGLKG